MQHLTYCSGLASDVNDLKFVGTESVWSFVSYLEKTGRLFDVICCSADGTVLRPPYSNDQVPALIEERDTHGRECIRSWTLQNFDEMQNLIKNMDSLFGGRDWYGSDEIAAVLAGNGITSSIEANGFALARILGVSDPASFVSYLTHKVREYTT